MGAPNFVRFSRIPGRVFDVMGRVDEVLRGRFGGALREIARLRPSGEEYDGGLELDGEFSKCDALAKAEEMTRGWKAYGLIYPMREVKARCYFYVYDISDVSFCTSLSFESSVVYFRNDDFDSGEWLERFLISMVGALRPLVCGYGLDDAYAVRHEPLPPEEVLARLRTGELLSLPRPIFHAISVSLIEAEEIEGLIKKFAPRPSPDYRMAPGYHVLGRVGL
jgi:hypothetical protein